MDNTVEEIKQKLDTVSVIGEYVQLKKTGVNFKGRCPFHNEKTPSFFVSPDRQRWHCFGCNEGGDIFTFVQKIEGLEFPEALKILAQKAGVQLKQYDPRLSSQRNRLLDVCSETARYWQASLASVDGRIAREYLAGRKMRDKTIQDFKIGYAPDSWDSTMKFLLGKGFTETEIFQAGLAVRKEKGTGYYDRFRHRLTFPIQDIHGNVIGFTARALKADEPAKYINTPEGSLYHKSSVLYGLDKAKSSIREQKYVIIVEGNMDAVTCHEAGFTNVVACSGTALTIEQINLLKRFTDNFSLCFDQDEAGKLAARRSIDLLLSSEVNTKIIQVLNGKDPDECIKNNPADWEESLRRSKSVMQFYFDTFMAAENLADIAKKKSAAKSFLIEVNKLPDKIEQDHWIKKAAAVLQVNSEILWESLPSKNSAVRVSSVRPASTTKDKAVSAAEETKEQKYLDRVFTILINYPKLIGYAQEYLLPEMILDDRQSGFYKNLLLCYNTDSKKDRAEVIKCLEGKIGQSEQSYLNSLVLLVEEEYGGFSLEQIDQELFELVKSFKILYFETELNRLARELARAEAAADRAQIDQYAKDVRTVSSQLAKLK